MSFYDAREQSFQAILRDEDEAASSSGSKKWIGASAAAAVVAAMVVGGMALINVMGSGGAQPEDVLPGSAMIFAKLDLNPSAGQKVAAYRLASKFPKAKDTVTSEDTSIKESTFGSIFTGDASWGLDYKLDVEPWLGDRIGVGVFPDMDGDKKPEAGLAIAFTDKAAAQAALDKAMANAGNQVEGVGYAFTDGFVILSDTSAHAAALVEAGKVSPLALPVWSTYSEDIKTLGSDQIGVAWADVAASMKALGQQQLKKGSVTFPGGASDPAKVSGRVVVGLHADPSFIELTGKGIEIEGTTPLGEPGENTETSMITTFPADVIGGTAANGLGRTLAAFYTSATEGGDAMGIAPMLGALGIDSAKQIETLLGTQTGFMVGGTIDKPEYAVRTQGGNTDAAYDLARHLLSAAQFDTQGITVHKVAGPDGMVVGVGPGLIGALTGPSGGKLGDTETFTQVMPGVEQADSSTYVNLAKLIPLLVTDSPKDLASLKPLNALGLTATGGAEPTLRLRLSVR